MYLSDLECKHKHVNISDYSHSVESLTSPHHSFVPFTNNNHVLPSSYYNYPVTLPDYSALPPMESGYSPRTSDMVELGPATPWPCWTSDYQPPPPPAFASPAEAELALSGYKIEAPKLEFGDSKHGDYLLKPEYHKLSMDYGAKTGQNEFLMKDYSHKSCPDYLNIGKSADNTYNETLYGDKYFPAKQF